MENGNDMMLSITADYVTSRGCPEPYLRRIAEAGFTHVHWAYHWHTDFLYSPWEIERIERWLREFGLQILDLHASTGVEKCFYSPREYEHRAGVELVKNRLEMAARLGAEVVILHVPALPAVEPARETLRRQVRKSLDALAPVARAGNVRIALENLFPDNFPHLRELFQAYGPDYIGLCYDSGHGLITGNGLENLAQWKDRLISVHLHDNDGSSDQHNLLFSGGVDWPRLAELMAASAYRKCVSMEVMARFAQCRDEAEFLRKARDTGLRLATMIRDRREPAKG